MSPLSDTALSALVAGKVAGWTRLDATWLRDPSGKTEPVGRVTPFATSADAVLPLLEKLQAVQATMTDGQWRVQVWLNGTPAAEAPTFARAACYALLKAAGVELTDLPR